MKDENEEIPKTEDKKVPKFLHVTYITVILFGIVCFIFYWNGSAGWPSRKAWLQLQRAAQTTFPKEKKEPDLKENKVLKIPEFDKK